MILQIFFRIILLLIAIGFGVFFFPFTTHDFVVNILGYQKPPGFFGFTWADWEITWVLTSVFWSGVIFCFFGKKIDYFFLAFVVLFAIADYSYPPAVSPQMYLGLIGVALVGCAIGYGLKLLRQKVL